MNTRLRAVCLTFLGLLAGFAGAIAATGTATQHQPANREGAAEVHQPANTRAAVADQQHADVAGAAAQKQPANIAGATAPVRWLFPAYANPCCDGGPVMWQNLLALARQNPQELTVIFNPASGPGASPVDPNYVNAQGAGPLVDLLATNAQVIGYIETRGAERPITEVKADIDRYYSSAYWYGRNLKLDGIFFDEVSPNLAHVGYYQQLRAHVLLRHGGDPVLIGNPGQPIVTQPTATNFTEADFARLFDAMVIFEGNEVGFSANYTRPTWFNVENRAAFASIVYGVPDSARMDLALRRALQRGHQWIYLTDDVLQNPYDRLPTFWSAQLTRLRALLANPPPYAPGSAVSGNWYNTGQEGHGFQLAMISATRVIGFWFTFDNAGNPAWIGADGEIVGNQLRMNAARREGGRFPPNFPTTSILTRPWGTLVFTFSDCDNASVSWNSTDPAFTAAGSLSLVRAGPPVFGSSCD